MPKIVSNGISIREWTSYHTNKFESERMEIINEELAKARGLMQQAVDLMEMALKIVDGQLPNVNAANISKNMLSKRAYTGLQSMGITTIGDLIYKWDSRKASTKPGIGKLTLQEIENYRNLVIYGNK